MLTKRGSVGHNPDQRLKVEFARRKNRRASITEQFIVPVAKSRWKEKLAQTRHYEFLQQPENIAAIEEIVDHVRRLAESEALMLGHVLSPMDKRRLHSWGNDVLALVKQFEPSGDRDNDPLLQLLEHLQGLQEGHECLAEVAIEARQVVERWERTGIFDDSRSSDEEEEEEEGHAAEINMQERMIDRERKNRTKLEASYAYQRVRERAAARVIKRNTLKWVRSRAAFCSRVEELEVFGNTTAALVEELTTMSDLQRRSAVSSPSNSSDVFDLLKAKKLGPSGHKIDFSDLMHFSKHLALFTVDHALRRVGEIENKRRLFQLRCLIKLQTWWRKMHDVVKGRRMLKLLEEVRRKKEEERATEMLRQKDVKVKAATAKNADASSRKASKAVGKNGKSAGATAGPSSSTSSSRSVSSPKPEADASTRSLTTKANNRAGAIAKDNKSLGPNSPATPKTNSISGGGGASKPKKQSIGVVSKDDKLDRVALARDARLRKEFEEELKRRELEDEEAAQDTQDVEAAWKRFMESAQNAQSDQGGSDSDPQRTSTASSVLSGTDSRGITADTTGELDDGGIEEWREWSDDEDRGFSEHDSRVTTPHSTASSRLSTPRLTSVSKPPGKDGSRSDSIRQPTPPVKVATKKRPPPRRTTQTTSPPVPTEDAQPDARKRTAPATDGLVFPYAAAPSPSRRQLLFGTSQARRSRPALPGTGQLSNFMPFAEFSRQPSRLLTPTAPTIATPRRHLHEMDFSQLPSMDTKSDLDMFLLAQPVVDEPQMLEDTIVEKVTTQPTAVSIMNPVRVFSSIRANRVARIRAALQAKGAELPDAPYQAAAEGCEQPEIEDDDSPSQTSSEASPRVVTTETFIVVNTEVRDALLRPIRGRASVVEAYISNPMLKLDFRREDVMRKTEEPQPLIEATTPEAPLSESPTTVPSRARFGSQADWLRSMGIDNASTLAARGPTASASTSIRQNKTKEAHRQRQLATSMISTDALRSSRVKQRRQKEHALPLLGKRSPKRTQSLREQQQPLQTIEHAGETLPGLAEHTTNQHRRSIRHERKAKDHRNKPLVTMGSVPESASEESLVTSVAAESESDGLSPVASDHSSDREEEEQLPANDSHDEDLAEELETSVSDEDGDDSAQESLVDEALTANGLQKRKSSRRGRQSFRVSNQRKRSSLHEPRHIIEQRQKTPPKKQSRRKQATPTDQHESATERAQSPQSLDHTDQGQRSERFRPHLTSLRKRLGSKDTRSFASLRSDSEDDACGDGLESDRESVESGMSEEADSHDPARTTAFSKLYSQYMGLLNAAPTSARIT